MAPGPLTVAAVQPHCVARDVAANAALHAAAVFAARARVVVFPELSLTGYELDAPALAPDDPRLDSLVAACGATGAIALTGAPVAGRRGDHIATLVVDGAGARVAYRKLWLGDEEAARFAPGDGPAALEVDGWRLGLAICRDTGVERHAAEAAALGIDAYVAGLAEHADRAEVLERRALRVAAGHGVAVVMASFAGATGGGFAPAAGRSGIWAAGGAPLARAGAGPGAVARATLSPGGPPG